MDNRGTHTVDSTGPAPVATRSFLVGTFKDPDSLMKALPALRQENYRIFDVFGPYPVHGVDAAMGLRRTRLPWVTLAAGLLGTTIAFTFQFYTNVFDWPLNVGGKPNNSTLAFIPVCFELTVLFAGLATVAALFLRTRLYPGRVPDLPVAGVTDDTFALVVRRPPNALDQARVRELMQRHGARRILEQGQLR